MRQCQGSCGQVFFEDELDEHGFCLNCINRNRAIDFLRNKRKSDVTKDEAESKTGGEKVKIDDKSRP